MAKELNKGLYRREGEREWYYLIQKKTIQGFGAYKDGSVKTIRDSAYVAKPINIDPVSRLVVPGEFV